MADTSIHLKDAELEFTLYTSRGVSLRELILNPFMWRGGKQRFRALNGISLDIRHGERIALIGGNGAGKSSLLKIISSVYPVTGGTVKVEGKVTPLLEMGSGFHPELTGRENLFLNGAILGFSRKEMTSRLERIIDFSEIPPHFLDTAIKYYSSGMQMRLAFSLATELEPQILLLDEIFAGGDAHFIEKAAKRMHAMINSAHIMIIVTHDLTIARDVATRGIWLDRGTVRDDGPVDEIIAKYHAATKNVASAIGVGAAEK